MNFNRKLMNAKNLRNVIIMERFFAGWLLLSTVICAWDAGFVLLRPYSMPEGDLEYIWLPYGLYIKVDERYGNMNDDFVIAQSCANILEGVMNIAAVVLLCNHHFVGVLIGYAVTIMTFWKTVIYFLCSTPMVVGHDAFSHLPIDQYILLFLIPNGVWIIIPLIFIIYYSKKIYNGTSKKYKTI